MNEPNKLNGRANTANGTNAYELGAYTIDVRQRGLFYDGVSIRIPPKTFELLLYFTANANRIVERDEIIRDVWDDSFVEESNLAVHIAKLRKILTSDSNSTISIETFPKIGYRLNGKVREIDPRGTTNQDRVASNGFQKSVHTDSNTDVRRETSQKQQSSSSFFTSSRSRAIIAISGLLLLSTGVGGFLIWRAITFAEKAQSKCEKILEPATVQIGMCDDSVTGFSIESNPNGNWSYGYTPKDNFQSFSLFKYANQNSYFQFVPGMPVDIWRNQDTYQPLILINTSDKLLMPEGVVSLSPGILDMHPGKEGERSVLRWTAPVAGVYKIEGRFEGIDINGTTTDVAIVLNSGSVLFKDKISAFRDSKTFVLTPAMDLGDTIDFSVGYGDNDYVSDSTGLTATIAVVSVDRPFLRGPLDNRFLR